MEDDNHLEAGKVTECSVSEWLCGLKSIAIHAYVQNRLVNLFLSSEANVANPESELEIHIPPLSPA